jgi:alpha/beta superfamily hydrolase
MRVIFSHGKESGPTGIKITAMIKVVEALGFDAESIDYRGMEDPEARADKLVQYLEQVDDDFILVGSSMGAYVSLRAAQQRSPVGLFLLAPAVYMPGYDATDISPGNVATYVMHGWQDEIVPVENALQFAENYRTDLRLVDDDHVLRKSLDLICLELANFLKRLG